VSSELPEIRLDADGYPADETIEEIAEYVGDWNALLD